LVLSWPANPVEAYRQLPPPLQEKVTEILKAHPDYEKWEKSITSESANLDLPAFIFMRSSTWPDEIRRRKSPYVSAGLKMW
jgi:hypothetical protein